MPYSQLTNAVMSDSDAAMVERNVDVRDGDDLVEVRLGEPDESSTEEGEGEVAEVEVSDEDEDESGTEEGEGTESDADEDEGSDEESPLPEYQKVDPKDLNEAASLMAEAEQGQADLTAKAMEAGLSQEDFDAAKAEFDKDGKFSEKSYAALAAAGYSKSFIDSYMAGQTAVAERFVKSIYAHVGGEENFVKISEHLAANKPEMAQAFDAAVERNDVATIRALLDAAVGEIRQSPVNKDKTPKRNLAAASKAATPASNSKADKVEGFTNRQEMVKAMSDARYQRDPEYRRSVELKVLHATF